MKNLASRFITEVFLDAPTGDLNVLKAQVYTFVDENQDQLKNYYTYQMKYKASVLSKVCRKLGIDK